MIIFRVPTGRSFTQLPTLDNGAVSKPLQFAHQTEESSFLESNLNQEFGRNRGPGTEQDSSASAGRPPTTQTDSVIESANQRSAKHGDVEEV